MTPERWKQVEEIFQAALDLAPVERAVFIAEACGNDANLREQVAALVRQFEDAGDFIEAPAIGVRVGTPTRFDPALEQQIRSSSEHTDSYADPMTGRRVGAYRIVQELGRGGMGAVYLARRDDAAFRKLVAIKLVKRGMDTDYILRRFRNERQILASLDHPHIARLLDGGTTDDGLPYFVMEYIEGQPLFRYCDRQNLTIPERLRLFCQACSAIHYAHQNRVVHRDIKPSNILITSDGTLKLLDFGIAKLLNSELSPDTITPTATAMRLMTPEYASPEQIRGDAVTPASDIYSLGVLLYELLTGHRPYRFRDRSSHAIARVICEEEPERPSTAIASTDNIASAAVASSANSSEAETLDYVCKHRGGTPESLRRELSGNLDNIILKALRKEAGKRYASVEYLCEDITRHLDGRSVSAPLYFPISKPVSKPHTDHEPATTTDKSIAVLPLKFLNPVRNDETGEGFLGVGLADALITRLSNLRRFVVRPTSSVLRYGSNDVDPFAAGSDLGVLYVVDGRLRRVGAKLRVTVQLLSVPDGSTVWANQFDQHYTDVLSLEDLISTQIAEALIPQLSGDEREQLAKRGTDHPEAYEAYMRGRYHWNTFSEEGFAKAITCYYRAIALDNRYALAYTGVADYYNWLGVYGVLPSAECFAAARDAARRAIEIDEALAEAYSALGFALLGCGYRWREAERQHLRALEINASSVIAHAWYSLQLAMEARHDEALIHARRAVELDPLTPFNHYNLGWLLYHARRFDESVDVQRRLAAAEPTYGPAHFGYGRALLQLNRFDEAIRALRRAQTLMPGVTFVHAALGVAHAAAGATDEARRILIELRETGSKRYVSPYRYALIHVALGEHEEAFNCLEEDYNLHDAWLVWLNVEPQFDVLRFDTRFADLLRRINYPGADRASADIAAAPTGDDFAASSASHQPHIPTHLPQAAPHTVAELPAPPTDGKHSSISSDTLRPLTEAHRAAARLPRFAYSVAAACLALTLACGAWFFYAPSADQLELAADPAGGVARLTFHLANDWHPSFSPDGTRIVLASNRDGKTEIYTMRRDGSDVRRLTFNAADDDCPVWSPDGRKIAFQSKRDAQMEIYVMDADGSNQINLTNNPAEDARPSWANDSARLVFSANRIDAPTDFDIYTMRVDGSDKRRLTNTPGYDVDPAWSPDGSLILFSSERDGKSYEIYTMRPDGSDVRNLTNHPGNEVKPAWSGDNRKIAFAGNRPIKTDLAALYVMNADGSDQRLFTTLTTYDDEPAWSPDSKYIIFQSHRDGNAEIYLADATANTTANASANATAQPARLRSTERTQR